MSASCVAELLLRVTDDQRCHVTLPRQNIGMFGFFWYVSVIHVATDWQQTPIDKRVEAIKGVCLCYFVLSLPGGGGGSAHDQAHHSLLGRRSSTRYQSFGTVRNELLIALLLLTPALLVMSNLCSAC